MMYFIDMVFIFFYLGCEKVTVKIQNRQLRWYFKVREILYWLQFLSVLIYLYARPVHNPTERLVSFGAMVFAKLVFDFVSKRECQRDRRKMMEKNQDFLNNNNTQDGTERPL